MELPSENSSNAQKPLKILFASSEVWPLMKTGGLADVAYNLPKAISELGQDIRIIMPLYKDSLPLIKTKTEIVKLSINNQEITLWETQLPQCNIPIWLVSDRQFSLRSGTPYHDKHNHPWPDNDERFNLFCQAVAEISSNPDIVNWQPDIVHCNDWQTGLIPVYLSEKPKKPATLFTVHNLAYQGLFPYSSFVKLGLNSSLWRFDALEFHNQLSFIKGGLVFADRINTVSPRYAEEVKTETFGCGLSGLFIHRGKAFSGILNGIDTVDWNPEKDQYLIAPYSHDCLNLKKVNKKAIQRELGLKAINKKMLIGWVGRLVEQKGVDLLIKSLPELVKLPVQLAVLGSGDEKLEATLERWAKDYPDQISVTIGYDESLAHKIIAGADYFLMPSHYEPCGLTQLYSLRYGTLPIATKVGGLKDSIVGVSKKTLADETATGILIDTLKADSLLDAIQLARDLYKDKPDFKTVQSNAMKQDFSWENSARKYLDMYRLINIRNTGN